MTSTATPIRVRECPYFGLDYYGEEWAAWFFGREAERNKIITNLRASRLTLLHASTGVGKSSLLRAGVVARLQELAHDSMARRGTARYVPVVFSSWKDNPVPPLVAAIEAAITPFVGDRPVPRLSRTQLDAAIQAAADATDATLFIILDQFEEYFNYCAAEEPAEMLAAEVARCINAPDLPANFLISIREDAYAGLGDLFKGRIANVYGNYLTVDYLDRTAAELAIREPLRVYNGQAGTVPVEIEPDLVGAVLQQVRAQEGDAELPPMIALHTNGDGRVETPLLQLVMERVWKQEASAWEAATHGAPRVLHRDTLDRLRGVATIVDTHLADALAALDDDQRAVAIDVFRYLVTGSGGKVAESVPNLANRTGRPEDEIEAVLSTLDHERIVRSVAAPPGRDPVRFRRYEIFHDVLAPAINRVVTASGEERLAKEKDLADEQAGHERRRAARFRRLAGAALALAIVAVGVLIFAFVEWQHARAARHRLAAANVRLTAATIASAADDAAHDPQLSALLARRALRVRQTPQELVALRAALPRVQAVDSIQDESAVNQAVFDPVDGDVVAGAGKDGVTGIWNVATGRELLRLRPAGGFVSNGAAFSLAFDSTGSELAVGYGLGPVVIFDAHTGAQRASVDIGAGASRLAFAGGRAALYVATPIGVRLWIPGSGSPGAVTTDPADTVAVDPQNAETIVVSSSSGSHLWRWSSARRRWLHTRIVYGDDDAEFSPDGRQIVTADSDGVLRLYSASTLNMISTLSAGDAGAVSAQFAPTGGRIVASDTSGTTRVWDPATGFPLTVLSGDTNAINSAQFSADGTRVVTASDDGTIRIWDAQPRELRYDFASSITSRVPNQALSVEYSSDGERMLVVDESNPAYVFTAADRVTASGHRRYAIGGQARVESAQFNSRGNRIVLADHDGTIQLWRTQGPGYRRMSLPSPIRVNGGAQYATFSPDPQGTRIAVVTSDGAAEIFSALSGRRLLPPLNPPEGFAVVKAVFSPTDGAQLLTADADGQVEVWNASTGHLIRTIHVVAGAALSDIEFSPTGREFVTTDDDGTVSVWAYTADRDPLLNSFDACSAPRSAEFDGSGGRIVVACGDGSAPIFSVSGTQLTDLRTAYDGSINDATFDPTGGVVATAYGNRISGGIDVWSSELATTDTSRLMTLAAPRLTARLTSAEHHALIAAGR